MSGRGSCSSIAKGLLVTVLLAGSPVAISGQPINTCGLIHDRSKPQNGREQTRIYVPKVAGNQLFDRLACVTAKAAAAWDSACPDDAIPELVVVRGERPEGNTTDIAVAVESMPTEDARWNELSNTILFDGTDPAISWACETSDGGTELDRLWHENVASHELGHALGLDHDQCPRAPGEPNFRSIMTDGLTRDAMALIPYKIRPAHCGAIRAANLCNEPTELEARPDCCFYCEIPRFADDCQRLHLPIRCGGTIFPPAGYLCFHGTLRITITITTEIDYPQGTIINVSVRELAFSHIACYPLSGPGADSGGDRSGEGPLLFLRTEYPEPVSGLMRVAGVLRDDVYGASQIAFWVDGQPVELQNLRLGLHDPYTCSEKPSATCDSSSRFEGFLDTRLLPDGPHTLQVIATNDRFGDEIPTFYEKAFTVANTCTETTLPTVSVTSPAAGSSLTGNVTVAASASDTSGISRVVFYVDDVFLYRDEAPPWQAVWDTRTVPDGAHNVQARAVDRCENSARSPRVNVVVANQAPITTTFRPTDDSFVSQDEPDRVFGAYNYLRVRTSAAGNGRHGYLKFVVTARPGPQAGPGARGLTPRPKQVACARLHP